MGRTGDAAQMKLTNPSSRHAVITDEREDYPHGVATINTEAAPGIAEAVLKAIEDCVASANTTKN